MPEYGDLSDSPEEREKQQLSFWDEEAVFEKSLAQNQSGENWVFYEGPPTANGRPHFGHLMPRLYKDIFPRYKTMQGYYVERKGGWDTHGLPVELEVEKELGINSKEEIEEFGVDKFIQKCKESVWEYKGEWEGMIERMGFWLDLEDPYITYDNDYIESLWWELKQIWENDLLYKGHKVLPYCPRCGTGLSSHEVAQGYELTEDPSIFVKFPVRGQENTSLLVWTTTPWTIPSNTAVAVSDNFLYAKVQVEDEFLIMAKALLDRVLGNDYELVEEIEGQELIGLSYKPPYPLLDSDRAYTAYNGSFVSLEEGTGIVHVAPAFGVEDAEFGEEKDLPLIQPVNLNGEFTEEFELGAGQFVKDADPDIVEDLRDRNFLLYKDEVEHEYPFCWRCETPLLYFALDSWYIRTTDKKEEIIANNKEIQWHPSHMRDGRFGDFLENLKDWALSRDRYWGTPLNIWTCSECDHQVAIGSREELVERAVDSKKAGEVELHRPVIDEIKLNCPRCNGEMTRVTHVIDTWFDSGSMYTAQYHYPFENQDKFEDSFPADFISEGQDQTRGWFYTLLVTSTLLYGKPAFKNVVVTGYGLDSEGKAMSKSRGNVIDPWELIDQYGADAVRWYLAASTSPWKTRRLERDGPADALYKFLGTVKNTYQFFSMYAGIDDFTPEGKQVTAGVDSPLDRWIKSRLNRTTQAVTDALDNYEVVKATRSIQEYVDDLSNWYIRCSRDRFWSEGSSKDKQQAYLTLYQSLMDLSKLLAPFVPFMSESIYRNLSVNGPNSVHLCDWPAADQSQVDERLETRMATAREITGLGRRARNQADIKVRQPLSTIVIETTSRTPSLSDEIISLIGEELNVKQVQLVSDSSEYYEPVVAPDFSQIGPKFGELAQSVGDEVKQTDGVDLLEEIDNNQASLTVDDQQVSITREDLQVDYAPRERFVEEHQNGITVLLDTSMSKELREEGYVREFIRRIQQLRKEAGYHVTDRIKLYCLCDKELESAVDNFKNYLKSETLSREVVVGKLPDNPDIKVEEGLNGQQVTIALSHKSS